VLFGVNVPESPPNVETHDVQPGKCGKKSKVDTHGCVIREKQQMKFESSFKNDEIILPNPTQAPSGNSGPNWMTHRPMYITARDAT
jgi:hypothetical protein